MCGAGSAVHSGLSLCLGSQQPQWVQVQVPAEAPFLIQFPATAPGNPAEDVCVWKAKTQGKRLLICWFTPQDWARAQPEARGFIPFSALGGGDPSTGAITCLLSALCDRKLELQTKPELEPRLSSLECRCPKKHLNSHAKQASQREIPKDSDVGCGEMLSVQC